jgi:hypothetical protein
MRLMLAARFRPAVLRSGALSLGSELLIQLVATLE